MLSLIAAARPGNPFRAPVDRIIRQPIRRPRRARWPIAAVVGCVVALAALGVIARATGGNKSTARPAAEYVGPSR